MSTAFSVSPLASSAKLGGGERRPTWCTCSSPPPPPTPQHPHRHTLARCTLSNVDIPDYHGGPASTRPRPGATACTPFTSPLRFFAPRCETPVRSRDTLLRHGDLKGVHVRAEKLHAGIEGDVGHRLDQPGQDAPPAAGRSPSGPSALLVRPPPAPRRPECRSSHGFATCVRRHAPTS